MSCQSEVFDLKDKSTSELEVDLQILLKQRNELSSKLMNLDTEIIGIKIQLSIKKEKTRIEIQTFQGIERSENFDD